MLSCTPDQTRPNDQDDQDDKNFQDDQDDQDYQDYQDDQEVDKNQYFLLIPPKLKFRQN